jgi:hypothetical protein
MTPITETCAVSGGSRTLDGIFDFLHQALDGTRKALAKESPREYDFESNM